MTSPVTIVNVGFRSTNYWVLSAGRSRLLVDLGWPGMMGAMRASCERMGVPMNELRAGFATHYHMDHAGLAAELQAMGMTLLVFENQVAPVSGRDVTFAQSRETLAEYGIAGTVVPTPGHSDDSVSLVLDTGEAFIGDLTPLTAAPEEHAATLTESWERLRGLGATRVYAGHGPIRPFPA